MKNTIVSKSQHPDYTEMYPSWEFMQHTYEGDTKIKSLGFRYLPPTAGQVIDGAYAVNARPETNVGFASYCAMRDRAVFPDFTEEAVSTIVGILNSKPPVVKVPKAMEAVLGKFTAQGENINSALRKIHEYQLLKGRLGLFLDMPVTLPQDHQFPYVAIYKAEAIINWDEGETEDKVDKLNLVVLEEEERTRSGFSWVSKPRFRTLILNSGAPDENNGTRIDSQYRYAVTDNGMDMPPDEEFKTPKLYGKALDQIPFVFVGSRDLSPTPDKPPLTGLARLCHTIYRGEADYRSNLYMQGQETLVIVGGVTNNDANNQESVRVGAGARIDVGIGGDAKYVGVSAAGLSEQRMCLEADKKQAAVRTGQLLQPGKSSLESGESLKTRLAAQTATLSQIAVTACFALETILKMMAKWLGQNEDEVSVVPNLDFINATIRGQDLVQLQTAKNLGFPISAESIHNVAKERGLTKLSFDEEMNALKSDPEILKAIAQATSGSLTGNNPVQSAGGGKKPPEDDKTGKGNQPNE